MEEKAGYAYTWSTIEYSYLEYRRLSSIVTQNIGSPIPIPVAVVGIVFIIFTFIYSLYIYPSLFTEKPTIRSNRLVSFLNGLVGWIIFGALWCSALSKKKKGVSQYIFTGLLAIEAILFFVVSVGLMPDIRSAVNSRTWQPYSKEQLVEYASSSDDLSDRAKEILTDDMNVLDDVEYPEELKRIQFGTIWKLFDCYGLTINGIDYETSYQLLAIAIYQMSGSESKYNSIIDMINSAKPEERRSWEGKERLNLATRIGWESAHGRKYVYTPEEPADKSKVYVHVYYPEIDFELGDTTWHLQWKVAYYGDHSVMGNGYREDCQLKIFSGSETIPGSDFRPSFDE